MNDKKQTHKTGKRAELLTMGKMLAEKIDVYTPLVDDHGVDAVIRYGNGPFLQVQIKATGKDNQHPVSFNTMGLSSREGKGFFVFYSEKWEQMWIMTRDEVLEFQRKGGKTKSGKEMGNIRFGRIVRGELVRNPDFAQFEATNFDRLKQEQ